MQNRTKVDELGSHAYKYFVHTGNAHPRVGVFPTPGFSCRIVRLGRYSSKLPWCWIHLSSIRHAVTGFIQFSDRLTSLKIRVIGGQASFFTAHAPTNMKDYEFRNASYSEAGDCISSQRAHGPIFALGDFNARIHTSSAHEESLLGPLPFLGCPWKLQLATSNR